MIKSIIESSIKNRFLVIILTAIITLGGIYSVKNIPLDAVPDLSDVQVIVYTKYPGQSPQVVEDQITYPMTTAMLSVPFAKTVRGYSFFGFSFVYVIFEDGTDIYWARSRVLEYLNVVSSNLPAGAKPFLGPDATGVGWVYEYALVDKTGKHDLSELRSIQDWYLKYELQTVSGVSEVASVGGFVKQYQVEVDPNKLISYNVSIGHVKEAINRSNRDVGGRLIEMAESEFMVRGLGYIQSLKDLQEIVLAVDERSVPILLKDVARIKLGPELRRGLVELDGIGETAGGIIVMRYGENALKVIENVKKKLESLKAGLPEGVEIVPTYDRSTLILDAISNLTEKLIEESIVVAVICIVFLLHFRSAFVAICTLPVGILISFILMSFQGINANIMSLGGIAIAIGVMIDGAIVMIENAHKKLLESENLTEKKRWDVVIKACKEVGPSIFFSLIIITVSFLPVFTLQAQEGRLFAPLAFTKTYAILAASLLSITFIPVLIGYFVRGKIREETENPINRLLYTLYIPFLNFFLKFRVLTLLIAIVLLASIIYPLKKIGSEFMPPLYEGSILYMPTTMPGISITKAKQLLQQTDKILKTFPEVENIFGKLGRAETATDPAPLSMFETTINLKPKSEWRHGMTYKKLVEEMDVAIQFPGVSNAWTMPIKARIDMLSTGIKTPVGIKIAGPDLKVLEKLGVQVESVLKELPDTLSAYSERVMGGKYIDIKINRFNAARYGLTIEDIQDVIQSAIGGMNVTQTVEGLERYPVNLRYPRSYRDSPERLKRVLIKTKAGQQIPLAQVADIMVTDGPASIKSENARLNAWIYVDIKTSDIDGYVKSAQAMVREKVSLPVGYSLTWSGQYEYMERAKERLKIIVPLTLAIIFLLLYMNFQSIGHSLIIMLTIPLSLVGGIWALYFFSFNFSVAVYVGFIALAGLTVEIGVLMALYINLEFEENTKEKYCSEEIIETIKRGAVKRLRPIIMTGMAVIGGLLPLFFGDGAGSDVMQRIALPMLGGMTTSMFLTLFVLPVIYSYYRSKTGQN
ncbi:MAG: efflux RND transporter permease subunit [Nitrospinae bacterium]|nr:efflux RND transporter permease subunit [Nitrospinota bacterium]